MTTIKILLITIGLFSTYNSQGINNLGIPRTPKAYDLENHFGHEPVGSLYGPNADPNAIKADLAREYPTIEKYKHTTTISNLHELNPNQVTSGELNNTAYDASKIISPDIAVPKAKIDSVFYHDAVVNTPVQIGTHIETKQVKVYNRITGEQTGKEVTTEKPVVSVLKNLRKVSSTHTTFVNLENGKQIDVTPKTEFVGV